MKALTFLFAILMLSGITTTAEAQYSRRGYSNSNTSTDAAYASNSSSRDYRSNNDRLSRRERQRIQSRLDSRARDLASYANELDARDARLNGRRARGLSRNSYRSPNGLLNARDLRTWDDRLNRQAVQLEARDRDITIRENRSNRRNRQNRSRGTRRSDRNNGSNRNNGGGAYCPPSW